MKSWSKLSALWRKDRFEREMAEEMQAHLDGLAERNVAAGMSPEEARYAAMRAFGGVEQIKERAREARGWVWLEQFLQDARYAVRQLRRSPGFTVTAIATIAIGIGACTALFSVVNGVLLRPLPFPEPDRVVIVGETTPSKVITNVAPAVYLDWAQQAASFEHLAALRGRSYLSAVSGFGEKINAHSVTANFFLVLGVQPILGRAFLPLEETTGHNRVVILSHRFWQSHFGGRMDVINQTIKLDDETYAIVGVIPDQDMVWNSAVYTPRVFSDADRTDYGSHGLVCVGRLKHGVTAQQAREDLEAVCSRIAQAHPDTSLGRGVRVAPLLSNITRDLRPQLLVLLGAGGVLLVIAAANVAGLSLARASAREREFAMRSALGASRGRIVRQFLCESALITAAGGALGTLIAHGSMGPLAQFASRHVPLVEQIHVDGTVLLVALGVMLATALGVGLIPALQSTRRSLLEGVRISGRGHSSGRAPQRLRTTLVIVEIALTLTLLTASGHLTRSMLELQRAEQGFDPKGVYLTQFDLGSGRRYDTPGKIAAFAGEVIARISALPAVDSAALTSGQPMVGFEGLLFRVEGTPELPTTAMPLTHDAAVTPDYFRVMRIPLKQGRGFDARDGFGAPRVAIISEELARRHFPGVNPIGRQLMIMTMADKPDAWREIIAIAGDIKPSGPQSEILPQVYEPLAQRPGGTLALVVRGRVPSATLPIAVNDAIRGVDPMLPVPIVRDFGITVARAWQRQHFTLIIVALFSAVALLLATIGVYGVMAFAVTQRTQEFGIRMALGAKAGDVLGLVIGDGMKIVALGVLIGTAGSLAFARALKGLLFNTSPADPITLAAVACLLALVAGAACWLPARRATKVDPMVALRYE